MGNISLCVKEGDVMKRLIGRKVLMVIAKSKFRDE
jgi:hypothetical protein